MILKRARTNYCDHIFVVNEKIKHPSGRIFDVFSMVLWAAIIGVKKLTKFKFFHFKWQIFMNTILIKRKQTRKK